MHHLLSLFYQNPALVYIPNVDQGPGASLGWEGCEAEIWEVRKRAVGCYSLSGSFMLEKPVLEYFGEEAQGGN